MLLFEPQEIVNKIKCRVDESFYATINGPKPTGNLNTINGSGFIMPMRQEPSVFWSKIDQFRRIEDRLAQRPNPTFFPFDIAFT